MLRYLFATRAALVSLVCVLGFVLSASGLRAQLTAPFNHEIDVIDNQTFLHEHARALCTTRDNGFAIIAETAMRVGMPLVKTGAQGEVEWTRILWTDGERVPLDIKQTPSPYDGYVIVGYAVINDRHQAMIIKTDASGNVSWAKRLDGVYPSEATSVAVTADNNYVVTGFRTGGMLPSLYKSDLLLLKISPLGDLNWSFLYNHIQYGLEQSCYGHDLQGASVKETADNGLIITGSASAVCNQDNPPQSFFQPPSAFLLKTDPNGNVQWGQIYADPGNVQFSNGLDVVQTVTGDYFVSGNYGLAGVSNNNALAFKTNSTGVLQWNRVFGSANGNEIANSVGQSDDGSCIASGQTTGLGTGQSDVYMVKLNNINGGEIWSRTYGKLGNESSNDMVKTADGRFALAGYTYFGSNQDVIYHLNVDVDNCFHKFHCRELRVQSEGTGQLEIRPLNHVELGSVSLVDYYLGQEPFPATLRQFCLPCEPVSTFRNYNFQAAYGLMYDMGQAGVEEFIPGTDASNYLAVGWASMDDIDRDIYLVKLDSDGVMDWGRLISRVSANNTPDLFSDEYAYDIKQTNNLGFIIAGDIKPRNSTDASNAYVVKVDNNGNVQWSGKYGRSTTASDEGAREIQCIPDANTPDGLGYITVGHANPNTDYDFYSVHLNNAGTFQWSHTYGSSGNGNDYGTSVATVDSDGDGLQDDGFIYAGYTDDAFGGSALGGKDMYVIRTTSNGTILWAHLYGGENDDYAYSIIQTDDDGDGLKDDGFILTGYTARPNNNNDLVVIKIDTAGTPEWNVVLDYSKDDRGKSVQQSYDGTYAIAGWTKTASFREQAWLLSLDGCGNVLWSKAYPEVQSGDGGSAESEDHVEDVVYTKDGGYFMVGSTCSYSSGGGTAAKGDFYVVKTYCNGGNCKTETTPKYKSLNAYSISMVVVTNYTNKVERNTPNWHEVISSDDRGPYRTNEKCICNTLNGCPDELTASTGEEAHGLRGAMIVPNPAESSQGLSLRAEFEQAGAVVLRVSDAAGRVVLEFERRVQSGMQEIAIATEHLAAGAYTVTLSTAEQLLYQSSFILR